MENKAYVVWYLNTFMLEYGVFESVADIETFLGEPVAVWTTKGKTRKGGIKYYFEPGDQHYPKYPVMYAAVEIPVSESGDKVDDLVTRGWVRPPIGQR